jgi:rod shape-determining protein MreC
MEALFSRYRTLTVLLLVVLAQLVGVAYQVRTNRDDRLVRVWAVTAVTSISGIVEAVRHNTIGFLEDYFILLDVRDQNRKLKGDNDKLRMENVYYRNQLATAENGRALTLFQAKTPSRTIAARVIGNSTVQTAKAVFIDRGSTSGLKKGMAVVTPEGIVGKLTAVYPLVAQVLLVTDPTFKVGVESQKGHIHGELNCGTGKCAVEQIQNEEKVDPGEWFFTSGEDRIFPKGFPVGTAVSVQPGQGMKDISLNLSGAPGGAEEVLVVLEGKHEQIPEGPIVDQASAQLLPAPPSDGPSKGADNPAEPVKRETEADKIKAQYDTIGKQENHVYGGYGSNLPDFNARAQAAAGMQPAASASATEKPGTVTPPASPAVKTPASNTQTAPVVPGLLGAPPGYKPPQSVAPQTPAKSGPAANAAPSGTAPKTGTAAPSQPDRSTAPPLLGAPHKKAATSTATTPQ